MRISDQSEGTMPEFKSKEEYERWKAERPKQTQQNKTSPKEIKQPPPSKTRSPYVENKSRKKIFLIIGILLIVLLPVTYLLGSYMTHGKLSGNVYVTMKSGDIKKAAGIEVYLLKIGDLSSLNEKLRKLKAEAHRTIFDLSLEAEDKKKMVDFHEKLLRETEGIKERIESSSSIGFVKVPLSLYDSIEQYRKLYQESMQEYKGVLTQIEKARSERNSKVINLLYPYIIDRTVTTINGFYQFSGIEHSEYYLYVSYSFFDKNIVWFEPIEANQRKNKLDLTNDNMCLDYQWEQD